MQSYNQNIIRHKTGLLNLAAELGNISKACRIMGLIGIKRHVMVEDPVDRQGGWSPWRSYRGDACR